MYADRARAQSHVPSHIRNIHINKHTVVGKVNSATQHQAPDTQKHSLLENDPFNLANQRMRPSRQKESISNIIAELNEIPFYMKGSLSQS